jgi:hypothetical protein
MRKLARRQWWTIAVIVGVAVLVILLGLVGAGILVVNAKNPSSPVTIQEVCVTIQQGTNSSGTPWFGPSPFCLSPAGSHLPYSAAAGSVVNVPIPITNFDTQSHTLYSAQAAPPFSVQKTSPALPYVVPAFPADPEGIDGGMFVWIQLPSSPGLASGVNLTINAIGAP